MHLLSIDFTWFLSVNPSVITPRIPAAMHGSEAENLEEAADWWEEAYAMCPSLRTVDISSRYNRVAEKLLKGFTKNIPVHTGLHHADILPCLSIDVTEVTNMDMQHDTYDSARFYADSRNWAYFWMEESPNHVCRWWMSEASPWGGINLTSRLWPKHDFYGLLTEWGMFESVFMCLSPETVPPHLWKYFFMLEDAASKGIEARI